MAVRLACVPACAGLAFYAVAVAAPLVDDGHPTVQASRTWPSRALDAVSSAFDAVMDALDGDDEADVAPARVTQASNPFTAPVLPSRPELELRPTTPQEAFLINASLPFSTLPNPATDPFSIGDRVVDHQRAELCLTAAVYYEAAFESIDGQRAVAQVVLNRVRHPAYPKTVCGVVFEGSQRVTGCQFTFTCDGALQRRPNPVLWERAHAVARAALAGYVMTLVGGATHYHADYVAPYWSPSLLKVAQIGAHIFYKWGGAGLGAGYMGGEPAITAMSLEQSEAVFAEPVRLQQIVFVSPPPSAATVAAEAGEVAIQSVQAIPDLNSAPPEIVLSHETPAIAAEAASVSPVGPATRPKIAVPAPW